MTTLQKVDTSEGIPAGWSQKKIGDLCDIASGGTPPKAELSYWRGTIPWVSGKDLKSPRLHDTVDHISEAGLNVGSKLAPPGAVLLLVRGMGLAKDLPVATIDRAMAFNQDVKALIPRASLPGTFLRTAIYIHKDRLLSRMVPSAHGTMTLNLDDIQNLTIPVPSDPADALALSRFVEFSWRVLDTESELEGLHSDVKRAAMRELFTKGLQGEAQKETEIGPIPESWDLTPFASVRHRLQYGTSAPCTYERSRHPVLRIPNVEAGFVNATDIKFAKLHDTEADRYRLERGDLIFIRTNGVLERLGNCAVFNGNPKGALFASYLIRAQLRQDRVDPRFAAYFFASDRGTSIIAGRATPAADGKYNLNTGAIDSLPLPLPASLEEQREIVAILDSIDKKVARHKEKRDVLELLFGSLLHKLMTGEVRIADLNLDALTSTKEAA